MAYIKNQALLHVANLASMQQAATIREVRTQEDTKQLDFHVRCWVPESNSSQMLANFELYPDTAEMRAGLAAIEEAALALRQQQKALTAQVYQLRNAASRL